MIRLTNEEIKLAYDLIKEYHEKYLKRYGVKLPRLFNGNSYTKDALTLVYLAQGYPCTRIVSKSELTEFIRLFDDTVLDVQQARHLGAQKGWFILSGTRNDNTSVTIAPGEYQLATMEKPYPGFTAARREEIVDGDYWENLKREYGYRCACCGSKEGEPHRYWSNTATVLQKGHKDGQCKDDLPEDIRPKSGYGNTYAKLWWDRPSTTITRNFACPSSSRCIHPRDSRAMSIREGARLQSFPDDYQFYGSDGMKRLEIGNAVPPLLSMAIANKVKEMLDNA